MLVVDGCEMPERWKESVLVPIYKGKGDATECDSYRGVKLLEHTMKVVEVLEQRLRRVVNISTCQCGFMPGKGTIDAIYIVRRMMEKYEGKG